MKITPNYWDERCRELSASLWLPTKQALADMPQSYANFEHSEALLNAWFDCEIYSLPERYHHEGTDTLPTPSRRVLRSRRIRIYPDTAQRETLAHWFDAARFIHNKTLEYLMNGNKPDWLKAKRFMFDRLPEWTEDLPYHIKAVAVREACMSFRTSGNVSFRARGNAKQSISIPGKSVSGKGIYPRFLGGMKYSETLPMPEGDCRLTLENGRYFVCVPVSTATHTPETSRAVSLDPGIRSFMTFYSTDSCGKIGKGAFSRLYVMCRTLDRLSAGMQDTTHRQRYRMRKAAMRLRARIDGLVEELQHKTASFLVKNFDVIALPEFREDFADWASGSMREVIASAHRGFQDFLRAKAEEFGKRIVAQDEAGTSGVCSWNGQERAAGRVIRDGSITADRDYNGARGIFLRALRESAIPLCLATQSRDAMPERFGLNDSGKSI